MPLAFRQWHLYRFAIMVPVTGLEPVRCRQRRILSLSRQISLLLTAPYFSALFSKIKSFFKFLEHILFPSTYNDKPLG